MGFDKKARWRQYWSKDPLLSTPAFPAILDRNRYEMIMKFFHFSDNSMEPPRDSPMRDRIFKIRPLVNHFTETFSRAYTPLQNICIDESLLLYKGRIIFKQYITLSSVLGLASSFSVSPTAADIFTRSKFIVTRMIRLAI